MKTHPKLELSVAIAPAAAPGYQRAARPVHCAAPDSRGKLPAASPTAASPQAAASCTPLRSAPAAPSAARPPLASERFPSANVCI